MMYRSSHLPRQRARLATVATLALVSSAAALGITADPAAADPAPGAAEGRSTASTDGPCTTESGVTVIIDFQELEDNDSYAYVRCAPTAPTSGFDALTKAGINWDPTQSSAGFLCRIAGLPSAAGEGTPVKSPKPGDPTHVKDACRVPSPTEAYWSYWLAPRGGSWCYANFGAGRTPSPGTVEGWSFVLNRSAATTPPPRIAPPAALTNTTPQLRRTDCTAPTEGVPPATSPSTPPATVPPAGPGPTSPSNTSDPSNPGDPTKPGRPSTPSDPLRPGSRPGRPNGSGSVDGPAGGSTGPSTSANAGGNGATSTTSPGATTSTAPDDHGDGNDPDGDADLDDSTSAAHADGPDDRGITDPDEIAALEGDIDLGDDGRSKGSPVPLIAAGVVAVGLVARGVRQRRRRPSASSRS